MVVAPTPAPYIKEMNDAGQFYTNRYLDENIEVAEFTLVLSRVLKDWKEKDANHVAWVKAWIATLTELQNYVKKNHTTGLVWNPQGAVASAPARGPGGPPPPPPGPPPPGPPPPVAASTGPSKEAARGALMDSLNKGADVTKGLRKVDKSEMTHKNPELRAGSVVKAKESSPKPKSTPTYGKQVAADKPSRFELDGKKWVVEYMKDNPSVNISDAQPNQTVYIYKCTGTTVKIQGKVNAITLDSCKKVSESSKYALTLKIVQNLYLIVFQVAVVFDTVVSSCDFINCQSVQMQV